MHSRQKLRSLFKISKRGRSKPQSIIKTWHKYPIITRFINFNERQHENSPKLGKSLEISYRSPIHFPRVRFSRESLSRIVEVRSNLIFFSDVGNSKFCIWKISIATLSRHNDIGEDETDEKVSSSLENDLARERSSLISDRVKLFIDTDIVFAYDKTVRSWNWNLRNIAGKAVRLRLSLYGE